MAPLEKGRERGEEGGKKGGKRHCTKLPFALGKTS
jgi:hypothetical protein